MVCVPETAHVNQVQCEQMLECDYLVIGAGARGLAFVDAVLEESKCVKKKVRIAIVDMRSEPGGHWNDAYRFAKLHHESAHYGVSSKQLEKPGKVADDKGAHYATQPEIMCYYSDLIDEFAESGNVEFFPMCTFRDGRVESLVRPDRVWTIPSKCKIVETAFTRVQVPFARPPPFEVGSGATVVPPNVLPSIVPPPSLHCVIGAGRTAIDVVLWLLSRGANPSKIKWVMPRDHWFMRREAIDGKQLLKATVDFCREAVNAKSVAGMVDGLERAGLLCRLDRGRDQTCFHGAAVAEAELAQLRSVTDIVRLGHVRAVHKDHLMFEDGVEHVTPGTLYVDCTSSWIQTAAEPMPIWQGRRIVLQPVQEIFVGPGEFNVATSAALVGVVEVRVAKDGTKNSMCTAGKHPDTVQDWLRMHVCASRSTGIWTNPVVCNWLCSSRLSLLSMLDPIELKTFMASGSRAKYPDNLLSLLQEEEEEFM
eukprot:CAMPEP_0204517758 /NCGR_PEP_ID=MMETSP0661-20131031/3835_1 /ASSEMBLY_ACC=CAM_ASM_000606 /TAXON_ID=109239 /ORGANISM="Alexandrium margalefi, Strain AMGDE01CS-322" /LENGTH=478 /DNA_ID=CAMNT_0051523171 /DNA_START=78 /DNA_END=1514 /DNA_ORIENTATION=-